MEKENVIIVENLVARFGDDLILNNVSFQVAKGEILGVLGGSGCGKTTLMRHMVGLNQPDSGRVIIDGIEITANDDATQSKAMRRIGILFQSSALFGSMTLSENVALTITEYTVLPAQLIRFLARMKLCMVGLGGYENHLPSEISGGMKKRAALARALALNPAILFLDEPSAGLDPITAAGIDDLILYINRSTGTTIVIITHELPSIFKITQRVIMLDKQTKGIIAEGPPHTLKNNSPHPTVTKFFNRKAE
jgi:phospholipid/cholesterol/gamma-HCH transport system ATP-binding protein